MTGEATTPSAGARLAARRPLRRPDLHEIRLDAELVVYDPLTGSLHQLDPIGSMVWELLDGTAALAEALPSMAEAFEADVEMVADDLVRLVDELDGLGLLLSG